MWITTVCSDFIELWSFHLEEMQCSVCIYFKNNVSLELRLVYISGFDIIFSHWDKSEIKIQSFIQQSRGLLLCIVSDTEL